MVSFLTKEGIDWRRASIIQARDIVALPEWDEFFEHAAASCGQSGPWLNGKLKRRRGDSCWIGENCTAMNGIGITGATGMRIMGTNPVHGRSCTRVAKE